MNAEVKLIKNILGLLNLAEELGNVSQACKVHLKNFQGLSCIHRIVPPLFADRQPAKL